MEPAGLHHGVDHRGRRLLDAGVGGRYSQYEDANLNNFVKTIKRIFPYYTHEKGKSIEWDCRLDLNEPKVTNRDYFYKQEIRALDTWIGERKSYEKYAGREELWLNKKGNPYGSSSQNYLLDKLIEEAGI